VNCEAYLHHNPSDEVLAKLNLLILRRRVVLRLQIRLDDFEIKKFGIGIDEIAAFSHQFREATPPIALADDAAGCQTQIQASHAAQRLDRHGCLRHLQRVQANQCLGWNKVKC